MSKRIILTLDDREVEILNLLLAKYGGKAPAYFRYLLKRAYEYEFGAYKSGKITGIIRNLDPKIELTDEQYCEKVGGKVGKDNNKNLVCILQIPGGGAPLSIPIGARGLIKGRAKQFGLI